MKNTIRAIAALSVLFAAPAFANVLDVPREERVWEMLVSQDGKPLVAVPYANQEACEKTARVIMNTINGQRYSRVYCSNVMTGDTIVIEKN